MKLANWNIEHMNKWFSGDSSGPPRFRSNAARERAQRVANVIAAIDPDVLLVQEGPSRKAEMEIFVNDLLLGDYEVFGPKGTGTQKLFCLIRRNGVVGDAAVVAPDGPVDLTAPFEADVNGNMDPQPYSLTREPLVVDVTTGSGVTRLVNLHLKSKFIQGGESMFNDPARRKEFIRKALLARRRISAEAARMRQYLDSLFDGDLLRRVIVAGDFNDGPGTDLFERVYLTHSLTAALAGSPFQHTHMLRHGFIDRVEPDRSFTVIFDDFVDNIRNRPILLDHILVSPGLSLHLQDGTIEHEAYDAQANGPGDGPSDHRPQSVTLDI